MKTKFTKEKWIREDDFIYVLIQDGWIKGEPNMTNKFWCSIQGLSRYISDEEKEANAKLIVKAPDLLKILNDIIDQPYDIDSNRKVVIRIDQYIINKAIKIIKEATE